MSANAPKAEPLIRKCVIPAAGLGTRFLPATKSIPKEMLPIVDTPTLQYIVEEAVAAGIEDVVLINGRGKSAIEDHFDIGFELETTLRARGKTADADKLRAIAELVRVVSIRQKEPKGLGHAVLCAKSAIGNEPFGVLLGDDMIDAEEPGIRQLARVFRQYNQAVIALMEVPDDETHMYGIAAGTDLGDGVIRIDRVVEKPKKGTAPSNLAVIGRYVLPPEIFPILETQTPGVGGEIQLTDGLATLQKSHGLLGYKFKGQRYDAGDKVGYLKANIAYALKRPELRGGLLEYMREVVKTEKP
ncbi:UTP--glucose-1-phosphate uridylyltransferase GalU [Myxococcus sp. AM011]|uniref:UTP--glucose-1-phosphate uridylyltransferase GalU n=1 Tax=Myxococcus TaxID=32 RepID=UPI0015955C53|nr:MULTISPECIES: UTP--glucose-1-phosphate uridylyltransferase GalU [Myxococcus]MCP3163071.1 UTP--glucose-1-phosphate uridylyltransferase GalU [Myxococcus qinghaiensis]NVJ27939.1 UTP--glucose-1-phosphate uridylyltransferase GalU [Myxococcus sp. AM011]